MRNFLIALLIAGSLIAGYLLYKKYQPIPIPAPTKIVTCDSEIFKDLILNIDYNYKLGWLQQYNQFVCNKIFYDCVSDLHTIEDKSKFEVYAKNYPGNNPTIDYYDMSYNDMSNAITALSNGLANCYDKHLIFKLKKLPANINTVIPSKTIFSTTNSCYSFPLFYGIFQKLQREYPTTFSSAKFRFCNAKIGELNKIVFKVEIPNPTNEAISINVGCFDISDEPTNISSPL